MVQDAHGPPSGPNQLATHTQSVSSLLPALELELAGQTTHVSAEVAARAVEYVVTPHASQDADPVLALYLPATHAAHCAPSSPV
jgi:hypothetical protein